MKAQRQLQIAARGKVRERRMQSARVRKYYDEYQVRQRSRMLKKRTKEELVSNEKPVKQPLSRQGDHLYGKPGNVMDFDSCL